LVTSTQDVNVNSGTVLHGIIYAPAAHVNLNATVFGSIVGDGVSLFNSGGRVHYDQSEACAPTPGAQVSAGNFGSCAIRTGGAVECWGDDFDGELGDGASGTQSAVPVQVQGLTGAVAITQGGDQACALLSSGTVECWGDNEEGALGTGSTTGPQQCAQGVGLPAAGCSTVPVSVSGLSGVVNVSAGINHTCAVLATGAVQCWGDNALGDLGDGTTTLRAAPVTVSGITRATAVSAGAAHTCALLSTGGIECWGSNSMGELGDGTTTNRTTPVAVSGITNAIGVAAGFNFTCAVLATGSVQCWGTNQGGQLGIGNNTGPTTCGTLGPCSLVPVTVQGLTGARTIGANGNDDFGHACAFLSNSTIVCWGDNTDGQLGDGTTTARFTPVNVAGLTAPTTVAVGGVHTCALLGSGGVDCWGSSLEGQIGNGNDTGPDQCPNAVNPCSLLPSPVSF
jgi:alpha-tubulin suppressor-like RCC1 family protein